MYCFYRFLFISLKYNLKAIHNKDYSVVKTFKLPRLTIRGFFYATKYTFPAFLK